MGSIERQTPSEPEIPSDLTSGSSRGVRTLAAVGYFGSALGGMTFAYGMESKSAIAAGGFILFGVSGLCLGAVTERASRATDALKQIAVYRRSRQATPPNER